MPTQAEILLNRIRAIQEAGQRDAAERESVQARPVSPTGRDFVPSEWESDRIRVPPNFPPPVPPPTVDWATISNNSFDIERFRNAAGVSFGTSNITAATSETATTSAFHGGQFFQTSDLNREWIRPVQDEEDEEEEDDLFDDDEDGDFGNSQSLRYNRRTQHLENEDEMSTVGEFFGRNMDPSNVVKHSLVEGTSRVGIEIEVEGFTASAPRMRYWVAKHDGSLRDNGIEFVFSNPLGGADIKSAIDEIDTILFNNRVNLNIRCSTHVHLDVRDLTVPQLKRLILSYVFFETFLFRQSGEHRLKSNFCTPLSFAEGLLVVLADVWNSKDPHQFLSYLTDRWDKYCGINLLPMRNFGSVEFRMAEAKSRKGQLLRLVNRFLVLKNLSVTSELNDSEFVDYLTTLDIQEVFRKGLTKVSDIRQEDFEIGYYLSKDIINRELIKSEK